MDDDIDNHRYNDPVDDSSPQDIARVSGIAFESTASWVMVCRSECEDGYDASDGKRQCFSLWESHIIKKR